MNLSQNSDSSTLNSITLYNVGSGRESGDVADPVRAGGYLVVDAWGTIQWTFRF